ncbi:maleylpyruvate isomerase N-terminal domain-containing protein, partial [Streptomyces sp. NPDC001856]|uniref:maleylpyruvate isomerase N-terminal domain-containing protein n=1 Tax=Streptomyces sp. NPDC001856 TaxID=3154399 RepID=UPI00331924C4
MTDIATTLDLAPQARIVARLAAGVRDEQLDGRTPCPRYAVRNLLGHLGHLAVAFRAAARKDLLLHLLPVPLAAGQLDLGVGQFTLLLAQVGLG